jgi:hypothetical protein
MGGLTWPESILPHPGEGTITAPSLTGVPPADFQAVLYYLVDLFWAQVLVYHPH